MASTSTSRTTRRPGLVASAAVARQLQGAFAVRARAHDRGRVVLPRLGGPVPVAVEVDEGAEHHVELFGQRRAVVDAHGGRWSVADLGSLT
jgi:hypothetical protein